MTEHKPDNWLLLKISKESPKNSSSTDIKEEILYKVLAGWSGGYTTGDSWRINSGIESFKVEDPYYYFRGYSGSVYKCHKDSETFRMNIAGILAQLKENPNIEVIDVEDLPKELEEDQQ